MTEPNNERKYPTVFYAAAGAGQYLYEQLRKLQGKAVAYSNEQAPQWKQRVADLSARVDASKVRETVVTGTRTAADTATRTYLKLVAMGEQVLQNEKPEATTDKPVSQPAAVAAAPAAEPPAKPTVKPAAKPVSTATETPAAPPAAASEPEPREVPPAA